MAFPPLIASLRRSATARDVSAEQLELLKLALENLREEVNVREILFFESAENDKLLEEESSKPITDEDIDDLITFSSVIRNTDDINSQRSLLLSVILHAVFNVLHEVFKIFICDRNY